MWVVHVWVVCRQVSDTREQRPGGRAAPCYAGPRDTADHCRPRDAADTTTDAERSTGTSRVRLLLLYVCLPLGHISQCLPLCRVMHCLQARCMF